MPVDNYEVYAPLHEFECDLQEFELAPNCWIRRLDEAPDLHCLDATLGEDEQNQIFHATFWLIFDEDKTEKSSVAEMANLVLLSLWLVRPTKAHIAYRFRIGQGAFVARECRTRLLDRFQWSEGLHQVAFGDADLRLAATFCAP